jgi:hypothetical protein
LSTDAQPVSGTVLVELDLLGLVLVDRIEVAQILDDSAVSGSTLVHGSDAVESPVTAPHPLQTQSDGQLKLLKP